MLVAPKGHSLGAFALGLAAGWYARGGRLRVHLIYLGIIGGLLGTRHFSLPTNPDVWLGLGGVVVILAFMGLLGYCCMDSETRS